MLKRIGYTSRKNYSGMTETEVERRKYVNSGIFVIIGFAFLLVQGITRIVELKYDFGTANYLEQQRIAMEMAWVIFLLFAMIISTWLILFLSKFVNYYVPACILFAGLILLLTSVFSMVGLILSNTSTTISIIRNIASIGSFIVVFASIRMGVNCLSYKENIRKNKQFEDK